MKTVKRLFVIAIIVCLSFTAAACSNESVFGVSNPTTPIEGSETADSTQSDSEPQTTDAYRNEYFNFKCVLPDEWYVLNRDEVAQVVGLTSDALSESDTQEIVQESLDSDTSKIDFYALTMDATQTINIVLSKAKPLEILLPEKQLLEASIPLLKQGLGDMGATNITYKIERIDLLGKEHAVLIVQGEANGVEVYETIFVLRNGFYMSSFAVTGLGENTTTNTLAYIQTID